MIKITLNDVLIKQGVSQRKIASGANVRLATVHEMVHNRSKQISLDNLDRICNYLNVGPGDILIHEKEPSE